MKIKTSELSGVALDWAVAQAVEEDIHHEYVDSERRKMLLSKWQDYSRNGDFSQQEEWSPSNDWSQGGPLIERFCSRLSSNGDRSGPDPETGNHYEDPFVWSSCVGFSGGYRQGKTALIAACRAIVAAKLGDEVDVPEGLV